MRIREPARALMLAGTLLLGLGACGGSSEPYAEAGPPSEAVEQLKGPESPYYIIYHPPVWLGKAGTEPGAQRPRR